MDFSYLFLCYLVPLFLILASGIWSFKTRHKNLPPGSFGWPLIGETIEFGSKPEKFVLHRMNKYSPDIFKTNILGEKMAVICGPNGHKFLFTNEHTIFTPFVPYSMQKLFLSSAPRDLNFRETVKNARGAPGFLKPEALVKYVGEMDSITQQQMQTLWEGKDEVKAFSLAKSLTLTLACRFFMGTEDPERVARAISRFDDIKVGMHSVPLNFPGTNFHKACKAAAAVTEELISVICEKKAAMGRGEPMRDIVSHMIMASDGSRKGSEVEIAEKILGLLVAGYSTVASVMTFFMKYVGERPDIYQKILAEQKEVAASQKPGELLNWDDMQKMKYSWNVVCEVMRLTPTIRGTFREVMTDFTYAGYTVPKGWKLYWTVDSTNMNPKHFPDPEKFDPSRYDEKNNLPTYAFTPFGVGPRSCPAKEYSRMAVLTFIHNVVKKFKWEMAIPDEKITGDMMPSPEQGLLIRLYHHQVYIIC
ncbi:beta-amyrin 28-monooxygenase-like [Pistacia vera]|uniref:beta-amyrin 28-monooxygenase-like n=1 Tax=Pistacia vera TaxID=55513 RepID=UPI00126314F9|nr:beta-amyrin 28-monooxygenase-like [Pistacia vera]